MFTSDDKTIYAKWSTRSSEAIHLKKNRSVVILDFEFGNLFIKTQQHKTYANYVNISSYELYQQYHVLM